MIKMWFIMHIFFSFLGVNDLLVLFATGSGRSLAQNCAVCAAFFSIAAHKANLLNLQLKSFSSSIETDRRFV